MVDLQKVIITEDVSLINLELKSLLSNYESNKINCLRGFVISLDDPILVKA